MDVAHVPEVARACIRLHRLGHAAGEEIGSQQIHEPVVERRVQPAFDLEGGNLRGELLRVHGCQEFRERHRPHVEVRHPAHRHREPVVCEGEVQQRSGGQNRQVAHVFPEVPQRGDGLRHSLDLVEEQQSVGTDGADLRQRPQHVQQVGGIVACECGSEVSVAF